MPEILSLPHASGGVSFAGSIVYACERSSPREWGCFQISGICAPCQLVFPTRMGVFPLDYRDCKRKYGLPHASGGVSTQARHALPHRWSSPREWGCFHLKKLPPRTSNVFPTRVGVFLDTLRTVEHAGRLPHASGGEHRNVWGNHPYFDRGCL